MMTNKVDPMTQWLCCLARQKGENIQYNSVTTAWWVVSIPCTAAHVKAVWPRPSLCGVLNIGAGEKRRTHSHPGLAWLDTFFICIRDEDLEEKSASFTISFPRWLSGRPAPFCVCCHGGQDYLNLQRWWIFRPLSQHGLPHSVQSISARTSSDLNCSQILHISLSLSLSLSRAD
jgi:hypothetical protein